MIAGRGLEHECEMRLTATPPERLPALVVETLSPDDPWGEVTKRITRFLSRGVPLVWLVDPAGRTVTVYRQGQLPQVVEEDEELTGSDVLPDFRWRVADFFYLPGEKRAPMA